MERDLDQYSMHVPVPFGKRRLRTSWLARSYLTRPSERASAVRSAALRSRALATESHSSPPASSSLRTRTSSSPLTTRRASTRAATHARRPRRALSARAYLKFIQLTSKSSSKKKNDLQHKAQWRQVVGNALKLFGLHNRYEPHLWALAPRQLARGHHAGSPSSPHASSLYRCEGACVTTLLEMPFVRGPEIKLLMPCVT